MPFHTFDICDTPNPDQAYEALSLCRDAMQPTLDAIAFSVGNALNTSDQALTVIYNTLRKYYQKQIRTVGKILDPIANTLFVNLQNGLVENNFHLQNLMGQLLVKKAQPKPLTTVEIIQQTQQQEQQVTQAQPSYTHFVSHPTAAIPQTINMSEQQLQRILTAVRQTPAAQSITEKQNISTMRTALDLFTQGKLTSEQLKETANQLSDSLSTSPVFEETQEKLTRQTPIPPAFPEEQYTEETNVQSVGEGVVPELIGGVLRLVQESEKVEETENAIVGWHGIGAVDYGDDGLPNYEDLKTGAVDYAKYYVWAIPGGDVLRKRKANKPSDAFLQSKLSDDADAMASELENDLDSGKLPDTCLLPWQKCYLKSSQK